MRLLSIIVPVYNVAPYLERCLDSILAQTYTNIELILINDGSKDNSGKICDEYAAKDSRVIVIHKENEGVSKARNKGLETAKGDYIGFVDSDDYIDKNMYEILMKNALESGADISYCGIKQVQLNGRIDYSNNTRIRRIVEKEEAIKGYFFDANIKPFMYSPWNKVFKKEILRGLRFRENLALGEDILFIFECIDRCNYLFMEDICLYSYMRREDSAMTSRFSDKRMDYIVAVEKIEEICLSKYPYATEEASLWGYIHKLVICRNLIRNPEYKEKYFLNFQKMKTYLKTEKKCMYHRLNWKRKLDYYFVNYVPWIYQFIK